MSGAAGEAGESSGGEANGAAGGDEGGAGGEPSSGGTASGSAGTANGGSAGANGGSSSGGNVSGGTAGSANGGASGNAGNTGQGATGGGTTQCGAAAKVAYANVFVAYFTAHVATSGCLSPQTHGADATQTSECASNGCGANAGCSATFTWHDVSYDGATGAFSAQVDVASALAVTGAATCTLNDKVSGKLISASVTSTDNDTSLGSSFNSASLSGGTVAVSGCEALSNAADIAADDLSQLVTQAEPAAVTAFLSYSVDCTP